MPSEKAAYRKHNLSPRSFVKDIFSKRFPELEAIVPTPLEYMQVVQRAGNSKDLSQVPRVGLCVLGRSR